LIDEGEFVFIVVDEVLAISQLHDGDLIFLTLLFVVLDLPIAIIQQLTALSNLVLQTRSLILKAYTHLSNLSVDHRLPLAFHHIP
jgi:hypothetical protein